MVLRSAGGTEEMPSNSACRDLPKARFRQVLTAALIFVTLLMTVGTRAGSADDGRIIAAASGDDGFTNTVLRPGINYVGWVATSTPPATLFEEVPQIEVIWAWAADEQRWLLAAPSMPRSLWTLHVLAPGMALGLRVDSEQSVEWRRDTSPARGKVELHSGSNFVAWAGPEGSSAETLRKGIGGSLEALLLWDGTQFTDEFDRVSRGAALYVRVGRDVNWLQPTGLMPEIYWVGGPTPWQRETVHEQVRQGLDAVAATFGIEADPSIYILVVNVDIEAVIELRGVTTEQARSLRQKWNQGVRFGNARAHAARTSIRRDGSAGDFRQFFVHEYAHVMQFHLIGADRLVSAWLMEGHAMWVRHHAALGSRSERDWEELVRSTDRQAREFCSRASLVEFESWGSICPYTLGFLAVEFLAEEYGEAAILDFWQLVGVEARAQGISGDPPEFETLREQARADPHAPVIPWRSAFQTAFGLSVDEFYTIFADEHG